jgi:hypothetical protein
MMNFRLDVAYDTNARNNNNNNNNNNIIINNTNNNSMQQRHLRILYFMQIESSLPCSKESVTAANPKQLNPL